MRAACPYVRRMTTTNTLDVSELPLSAVTIHTASGLVFVSGQIAERQHLDDDVAIQTASVLRTLGSLLSSRGKSLRDVLRVGVFLADMNDYSSFNETYRQHFHAPYPARTTVAVQALPLGARVEIDVVVG
jgi:2-iminobutanoate/2-iminopropanoate deaminase